MQHQWRRRYRRGKIGRPPKPVATTITNLPEKFEPSPKRGAEPIFLEPAEIEALKLVELEKLTFEEAAAKMKVSRNTAWRLAEKAREKLARAIVEGREILIQHEWQTS
ncbi:MAG: DUF134 domain-containing protein [Candidatus Bathyarchaeia archaeon]